MNECVFCRIVAGDEPPAGSDDVLTRTRVVTVFAPMTPVVDGHVLIVPNRHVVDAAERVSTTGAVFMHAAAWANGHPGPFNLITSAGRAATQTVDHLHVHYVPRAPDDGLHLPWTEQTR